jgi:hypothetical protein
MSHVSPFSPKSYGLLEELIMPIALNTYPDQSDVVVLHAFLAPHKEFTFHAQKFLVGNRVNLKLEAPVSCAGI